MAYERLHWVESETPLSADNMNNIEDGIEELQAQKVDKVSGKALSDNNYTSDEKTKLAGIEAGAQVNPGEATTSEAGLMSATDKSKLDGIEAGAQVNPGLATESNRGLMSAADKKKLNDISSNAVHLDWETLHPTEQYTLYDGAIDEIITSDCSSPNIIGLAEIEFKNTSDNRIPLAICGYRISGSHLLIKVFNPRNSAVTVAKSSRIKVYYWE